MLGDRTNALHAAYIYSTGTNWKQSLNIKIDCTVGSNHIMVGVMIIACLKQTVIMSSHIH